MNIDEKNPVIKLEKKGISLELIIINFLIPYKFRRKSKSISRKKKLDKQSYILKVRT